MESRRSVPTREISILIGMLIFLLWMGNSAILLAQEGDPVEYEELPVIQADIDKEIGDEQGYLPGRLSDLILMSDGTLLVSDVQKKTIEQFNTEGKHMGTIAREGRGPGELPFIFTLAGGGNDTLIVQHSSSTQVDFFGRDSGGIYTHARSSKTDYRENYHPLFFVGSPSGSSYYYAIRSKTEVDTDLPEYKMDSIVMLDGFQHIIRDSLHMLKRPNYVYADPTKYSTNITFGGKTPVGMPPYRYQDRFRLMDDGQYLIARPDSTALFIYNKNHELVRQIPLNVESRSVQKTDLDYHFRDEPRDVRQRLKRYVPELKPPFLNIWVSENHILLHTDNSRNGKEMVVLTMKGEPEPIGKFYLSEFDDIRYFRGNRIYTLYKNPERGHSIMVYSIDL
ncbi:hypothetical protein LQ318_04850 [Aliifodinibius salicampi]|uniref:6-bladed beta-propeller protein n=1 Tax=Fodinibius salicampi TaxID=1920655 RepID=A0ABT3PWJ6_9BACT|nr:hypothetical protein [Fodinibius salicampi]MCW9712230.1 hypothetical protein [Fodinibius salicampi]